MGYLSNFSTQNKKGCIAFRSRWIQSGEMSQLSDWRVQVGRPQKS